MKSDNQLRVLLLLRYLYEQSSEEYPVSVMDILHFWKSQGIHTDRKSVYRDITVLKKFGLDIVQRRERQNLYFVGSRLFELPELKLLVDAVKSSHFITRKKSADLLCKLSVLASQEQVQQLDRPVYMDGTAKQDNEGIYYTVDTIHTAIREQKQITFQYTEYTPEKKKVLKHDGYWYFFSPYALIWSQDFYYAVGWSEKHDKLAQFRVDRMIGVELLERPTVPFQDFNPSDYVRQVFGMYGTESRTVELLCKNHTMRSVIDRFGEGVHTELAGPEHFKAVVEVAPSPPFFAWVFTFAGNIRIISPPETVEKFLEMAKNAIL
ncbi:WYL domain-containing protein [Colidextribacter sp. OB.20]|uniref:helix-turn-helix transcriptional regulator n=1 Tax=Colidextribacter sp. OB.20 TaxID=2304568 RepID=UPI00136CF692|nr:WYL domain-containing protein [Colidextribacter sp. OB.20]NBI11520.1 WYL domain-containing protein [Colidextribacter sp. OB.20]